MRTDFTPITNALESLVSAISIVHNDLLAKANAERVEALVLFAKMRETHDDLATLGAIVNDAATQLNAIEEVATDISEKVFDAIDTAEFPEVDYEDFIAFCDSCGESISQDTNYVKDDGYWYCEDCAEALNDEDNDEPVEGQMTLDIPAEG